MELLDELYSGVPSIASADIRAGLATSYAATLGVLFLVPGAVAVVVEPVLFVLADRYPRKWFVCGGLLAMACAAFAAAVSHSALALAAAMAIAWVGSGSAVNLAQASLVDARPAQRERTLARWALLGEIGDLLAPILLGALATAGLGWRTGYLVVGVVAVGWAMALVRQPFVGSAPANDGEHPAPDHPGDAEGAGETEPDLLAGVREALRNRRLLLWLGGAAMCDLLDEIVVALAALYLRDHLALDPAERSLVFAAGVAGAIGGALLTDRLLARVAPLRILGGASLGCALVYAAWLVAPNVWLSAALFAAVGATAAPMYPIASAQAYAALPRRSGTVHAAAHLFTPLTLTLPWALGALADATDVRVALALLLAQPLGLLALALGSLRSRRAAPCGRALYASA